MLGTQRFTRKRRVGIFGSTGSVGVQALDVVSAHPDAFEVVALGAGTSIDTLGDQVRRFHPKTVVVGTESGRAALKTLCPELEPSRILVGKEGLSEAAGLPEIDCVVSAITGISGLPVSLAAVKAGKRLALANKESMVAAGTLIMAIASRTGAEVLPIDSEHSALFQCLASGQRSDVRRLILTGSGGPFRTRPLETWKSITIAEALKHPTWSMGRKISIDSATMMNKALEIVEAHHLFGLTTEQIAVTIHPQSVVHSLVEFVDGSVVAQLGSPDMRIPIQLAMTWPERLVSNFPGFSSKGFTGLTFEEPDHRRFPSLELGFEVTRRGGLSGAIVNAANERAVALFLEGEIPFASITDLVANVLSRSTHKEATDLESILEADQWAREEVQQCLRASPTHS